MEKLKVITKTVHIIDYDDFDKFVMDKYGGNFEFVAEHEANNYSEYEFTVPNKTLMSESEGEKIRSGKYVPFGVHKLFKCLYEDNFLHAGTYIIKVSW